MKKIVSIIMAVAVLVLALNIVGCVPPGVSQEEYNAEKSELPPISVLDKEGQVVEISVEDVWTLKGIPRSFVTEEDPWSALAFRATRLAISQLWVMRYQQGTTLK